MDKIEKAIFLKFLNYVTVTVNWFVRRWEKQFSNEIEQKQLAEIKSLLKQLEENRDELERGE